MDYMKISKKHYTKLKGEGVTEENLGAVLIAALEYAFEGKKPDNLPANLKWAFMVLRDSVDRQAEGLCGAAKRWEDKEQRAKVRADKLDEAYRACENHGAASISSMAELLHLKPDTVRRLLKDDGRFWLEPGKTGRKKMYSD